MERTSVEITFQTCTTMEAVEEVNIALKEHGYDDAIVTEDDLIGEFAVDNDFGDSGFIFKTTIADTIENIKEAFRGEPFDVEFPDEE